MGTVYSRALPGPVVFFQIISFCASIEFALKKRGWLIPICLGDWIKINKLKQKPFFLFLLSIEISVDSKKIN